MFEGEVGDDFVGVHVEAGAGAALEHVDGELVHAPAADEVGHVVDGFPGDVEVIHGPEGVDAVVVLVGYFHFPQ